jgi:hypothetical protein
MTGHIISWFFPISGETESRLAVQEIPSGLLSFWTLFTASGSKEHNVSDLFLSSSETTTLMGP